MTFFVLYIKAWDQPDYVEERVVLVLALALLAWDPVESGMGADSVWSHSVVVVETA